MYHSMPEVHGCGDDAKASARADCKQQARHIVGGVLIAGKDKQLRPEQRQYLQGKLDKSIKQKEEARAAQKAADKKAGK